MINLNIYINLCKQYVKPKLLNVDNQLIGNFLRALISLKCKKKICFEGFGINF